MALSVAMCSLVACASAGVRSETAQQVSVTATTGRGTTGSPAAPSDSDEDTGSGGGGGSETTAAPMPARPAPVPPTTRSSGPGAGDGSVPVPGDSPSEDTGDGVGDELYPGLGNPGLDVLHYDVDIDYDHDAGEITGDVGLDIRFTADRDQFTLDSSDPQIDSVTVAGEPADFEQDGAELRITPAEPVEEGEEMRVEVRYHLTDAMPSDDPGIPNGWFRTPGGSYVLDEPDGARNWLPSNDHPSDKATYRFEITVASGVTAVANGVMTDHTTGPDGDTWVWEQRQPMTTYLIQLLTGDYELIAGTGPDGLPLLSAVLRRDVAATKPYVDAIAEQIEYFQTVFGPYPLDSYGIAISDSFSGLAMETQGRSLFSRLDLRGPFGFGEQLLLAHELAHQWFGDAVSPARWQDIWLNESFASYGQWLWLDHIGLEPVASAAQSALDARPPGVTAEPSVDELFGFDVYEGGAVALHALRLTIGDQAFFELLQRWVSENLGTSRTTEDFIELAEDVSGTDLEDFFDAWIFSRETPPEFPAANQGEVPTTTS